MAKHLVAVYGTLRKGFGLNRVLEDSEFVGTFREKVGLSMKDVGAFPALVPSKDQHEITFEVYEVDDATLHHLDLVEGVPTLYTRRTIQVGGSEVNVYVYASSWGHMDDIPSGDYKEYRQPMRRVC